MDDVINVVISILLSFIISLVLGYFLIPELKKMKFGQTVRDEGPKTHAVKNGVPTMGGLIFIITTLIVILLLAFVFNVKFTFYIGIVLVVFIGYSIIGFVDDYLNIKYKSSKGLTPIQKLVFQFIIAGVVYYLYSNLPVENLNYIKIETLNISINLGPFYFVYILLMIVGFSNAVNFSDGLDGLSTGLCILAFIVFGLISRRMGLYIPGLQDLSIFSFVIVGSLIGFLFYNVYPAKVFMGDTGSLPLGAVLATIAILTRHDVTLFIVGGVFIIEILSVILQVLSFKLTGRRIFLMAPIHHHFELLGWSEPQIVRMFWGVGFVYALLGLLFGVIL